MRLPKQAFRLLFAFATLMAAAGAVPTAGRAQDVGHIAAVVNDEVISVYDLNARTRVIMSSTRLPDNAETRRRLVPQILRSLIDEKLQLQEAKRLNIGVTNEELAEAFRTIEKQNSMPSGKLKDIVESAGIPFSTIESQTRAALAWGKVVRRQVRNLVQVGPEEVQDEIARLEAARNRPQSLASEIFLSVDSINQEDEVRNAAIRLAEQVRGGAAFEAMARQFSQSASAASGGDLGWVVPGTLPEELDSALARLQPGQITDPVRSVAGYHILLLRDRQVRGGPGTEDTTVGLQYVFIRLPQSPTAEDKENLTSIAKLVRENAQDCADMAKLRNEVGGTQFPLPEKAKMKDMSENLR
ncbi:MAG: peptidylprolyl isomerase, partial [Rhizobiaceae bacterium]